MRIAILGVVLAMLAVNGMDSYIKLQDGVRLYFQKSGSDAKVLVVPNGIYLHEDFQRIADLRTVLFYDVRNRGMSDTVSDKTKLARGIQQDVDDLEEVRKHLGAEKIDLLGHSYIGVVVALYALKYPEHVNSVIQIGPMGPDPTKNHPGSSPPADETSAKVFEKLAQLGKQKRPEDPVEACKQFWEILAPLYVMNPEKARKVQGWGRCDVSNERNFMSYWRETIFPSLQQVHLSAEQLAPLKVPFLIIHGTKDRNAPYAGAMEWDSMLPNSQLVSVEDAAHAPWIEDPETVFGAIEQFLKKQQ